MISNSLFITLYQLLYVNSFKNRLVYFYNIKLMISIKVISPKLKSAKHKAN